MIALVVMNHSFDVAMVECNICEFIRVTNYDKPITKDALSDKSYDIVNEAQSTR